MAADIRRPNVVFCIHPYRMRSNKEIISDAAKEFPTSIKFHQRMFATMKHVDMTLGIYRHTSDLNEMLAFGQLKEIGNSFVIELGNGFLGVAGENQSSGDNCAEDSQSEPSDLGAHDFIIGTQWACAEVRAIMFNVLRVHQGIQTHRSAIEGSQDIGSCCR